MLTKTSQAETCLMKRFIVLLLAKLSLPKKFFSTSNMAGLGRSDHYWSVYIKFYRLNHKNSQMFPKWISLIQSINQQHICNTSCWIVTNKYFIDFLLAPFKTCEKRFFKIWGKRKIIKLSNLDSIWIIYDLFLRLLEVL